MSNISLNCVTRRTLLDGVKAGNQCKITEFYNGYKNIVRVLATKVAHSQGWCLNDDDLANIIQDVLASILKDNTLSYNVEKGAKFRTWLRRVVQNKVVDLVRAKCRVPEMVSFDDNQILQGGYKTDVNEDDDTPDMCSAESDDICDKNEEQNDALEAARSARKMGKCVKGKPVFPRPICDDPLKQLWDEEWHRELIRKALIQLKKEKDPVHYHVFCLLILEDNPAEVVAENLGLRVNNVYAIRSRCAQRMKTIIQQLEKQL